MIRFISDLAAQKLWPLFLIGCFVTTLFFNISFYQFVRQKEHHNNLCIYLSFIITIIGGLSLLMIGVFDNIDFKHLHDVFVTIFMWVPHTTPMVKSFFFIYFLYADNFYQYWIHHRCSLDLHRLFLSYDIIWSWKAYTIRELLHQSVLHHHWISIHSTIPHYGRDASCRKECSCSSWMGYVTTQSIILLAFG